MRTAVTSPGGQRSQGDVSGAQGSNPRQFARHGRPTSAVARTLLAEEVGHILLRDRLAQAADAAHVHSACHTLKVLGPSAGCAEHAACRAPA